MDTDDYNDWLRDYHNYDIRYAAEYADVVEALYQSELRLEITGDNDGPSWHWIFELANGEWLYLTGGCDYTGWD